MDEIEHHLERYEKGLLNDDHIDSPRMVALLDEVWQRLPEEDCNILRDMYGLVVTDDPRSRPAPESVFGSASGFMGSMLIDGISCMLPDNAVVFLNADALGKLSDAAAQAVIAHELAHIILRHACLGSSFAELVEVQKKAVAKIREVHEWAANHQVWMWGFTKELLTLWQEVRQIPDPWYAQPVTESKPETPPTI